MKIGKVGLLLTLLAVLIACAKLPTTPPATSPIAKPLGLLKVTISGIGEGASPTATAEWVQGVKGQAATVVPVNGTANLGDVEFIQHNVGVLDNDISNTRYVSATFDLVNRSTTAFNNLTLYAVNVPDNLGGTGIFSLVSGAGETITDPEIARGFMPTHGMRPSVNSLKVNEDIADLQFFTPEEVDNPTDGIKQQAVAQGILSDEATVLEYGFVARNYTGNRHISAPDQDCTYEDCKGAVTLAYQFPKISPRSANPFSFSLYFVVANETEMIASQSIEEQAANTVMGLNTFPWFTQIRTLAGSSFGIANDLLVPMCRVKTAIGPDLFLGDPIPGAPGSLDVCFGASGKRITSFDVAASANAIAIQSDGNIVAAGRSGDYGHSDFALVRYKTNGSLDTSFGLGGKVTTDVGDRYGEAFSLVIQSDGKIVVAGRDHVLGDFILVRYNPNGSLDTTFDGDGVVKTDFNNYLDSAHAIAIQSDGKIVLGGYTRLSSGGNWEFALARYNPNGSLDTTFDGDGQVTTDFGSGADQAYAIAIQSDGKIVLGGSTYQIGSNNDFALARYNPDGSLDTSFGGIVQAGKVITSISSGNDSAHSLAIQSDGMIVLGGYSWNGSNLDFTMVRYNPDGFIDTGFGVGGIVKTDIASSDDGANFVGIQSDGKIVLTGNSIIGGNWDFALARYNTDGSLDTTFGADGKVTTAIGSGDDISYGAAIQSDGKIVLAGVADGHFAVARYNP